MVENAELTEGVGRAAAVARAGAAAGGAAGGEPGARQAGPHKLRPRTRGTAEPAIASAFAAGARVCVEAAPATRPCAHTAELAAGGY